VALYIITCDLKTNQIWDTFSSYLEQVLLCFVFP
jgi:hypothetical protein